MPSPGSVGNLMYPASTSKGCVDMSFPSSSKFTKYSVIKKLGIDLKLIKEAWEFVWITGYPLFEQDTKSKSLTSVHHPFTSPVNFDDINKKDLLSIESRAYDLILNGNEIGGGSIRIHSKEQQIKIFEALGISEKEMQKKFGFFLNALDYGCPPHGGIA